MQVSVLFYLFAYFEPTTEQRQKQDLLKIWQTAGNPSITEINHGQSAVWAYHVK